MYKQPEGDRIEKSVLQKCFFQKRLYAELGIFNEINHCCAKLLAGSRHFDNSEQVICEYFLFLSNHDDIYKFCKCTPRLSIVSSPWLCFIELPVLFENTPSLSKDLSFEAFYIDAVQTDKALRYLRRIETKVFLQPKYIFVALFIICIDPVLSFVR